MREKSNSLEYSMGKVEDGILENMRDLASPDANKRLTAQLNRDLVAVLDKFMAAHSGHADAEIATAAMLAMMHGTNTVCGTILVNIPREKRKNIHSLMRDRMVKMFDAMGEAVSR